MECLNCKKENAYGVAYCLYCGEKISKESLEKAYRKTFFGKIQTLLDKINSLWIKKVYDNIFTKIVIMLLGIVFMILGIKGDAGKLRLEESQIYQIQYDTKEDEYYIITDEEMFSLALYIPKFVDSVRFSGYKGDELKFEDEMKPEEVEVIVKKSEFSNMKIETIRKEKVRDTICFSCK